MLIKQQPAGDIWVTFTDGRTDVYHVNSTYQFEIEHWYEWFLFIVSNENICYVPDNYYTIIYDDRRDLSIAVRKPFYYIVLLYILIAESFHEIGRVFYRHGLLKRKKKEGESYHWFWPVYLFK